MHARDRVAIETAGMPLGQGEAVVIMIHGRGASPQHILSLVPALARPGLTYLAPAAPDHAWYPLTFLSELSKNEPHLTHALGTIDELTQDVMARGIGQDRIVLLGFSQGACLASEFAVRHAGRWGGVLAFSGGLIGPPGQTWTYPGAFDGMPVFLGCSDVDSHIPKGRVEESAAVFERMGAEVTLRLYEGMGHTVNDEEIAIAQSVLDRVSR